MSLVLDILAGAFAQALDTATVLGLQKIKETKGDEYYTKLIMGAYPTVAGFLKEVAEATKTKLDDKGVDAITDAIETSAASNGITLPPLTPVV